MYNGMDVMLAAYTGMDLEENQGKQWLKLMCCYTESRYEYFH